MPVLQVNLKISKINHKRMKNIELYENKISRI